MKRIALSHPPRHRRGVVLVIVLLVVLLILGLAGSLSRLSIIQHNQSRHFELQAQADWLARAGLDRAIERLSISDFTKDTWVVEIRELGAVEVVTRVITSKTTPGVRHVASHVRLSPEFARTPVHGHGQRTIGLPRAPTKDSP